MSEELAAIIRDEIRLLGPIPFSRWMELCLYHPQYGYYMKPGKKTGYGRDADFVTPPTLHPFFGIAVAKEARQVWIEQGRPAEFLVVEFGGGEGGLCLSALAWADQNDMAFARSVRWLMDDRSPAMQTLQQERLRDPRVSWGSAWKVNPGVWVGRDTPQVHYEVGRHPAGLVICCEVLDAIPFNLLEMQDAGWLEIRVGLDGDNFCETTAPAPDFAVDLIQCSDGFSGGSRLPFVAGQRALYQFDAAEFIEDLTLQPVATTTLVFDYGDRRERLWKPENMEGTLRGFSRQHHVTSVLENPGDCDITGSVDFSLMRDYACNAEESSFESLEAFLLRHGILEELNSIDRNTVEGASSYLRLRQLLLPTGMGAAFKVQRFDRVPAPTEPA